MVWAKPCPICDRLGFSENYKIKELTNVEIEQLSRQ